MAIFRLHLVVAVLCICAPAYGAGSAVFPEHAYDFGTVKQGEIVSHAFPVRNEGVTPVTIERVELAMPGVTARFRPLIAAGGEGKITLEWNTSHVTGEMGEEAIVHFDGASQPMATLLVKAVVKPPLELLPFPAIFLSAFQGEKKEGRLRILNNEEKPVAISLAQPAGNHFTASLSTVEPGRIYEIAALITATASPGHYDEELSLKTDSPKRGEVTIPVHLFVKPDLYANPDVADFGQVSADELRKNTSKREFLTQTFLVQKREGSFAITRVRSTVEGLDVRIDPKNGKSSTFRVDVGLNPERIKTGKLDGFILVETDDKNFPEIRVPVSGAIF